MSLFLRRKPTMPRHRPSGPSCRGGASSLLRLAQPASAPGGDVKGWLTRAAGVFSPGAAQAVAVRPSEFAPSQWLNGH